MDDKKNFLPWSADFWSKYNPTDITEHPDELSSLRKELTNCKLELDAIKKRDYIPVNVYYEIGRKLVVVITDETHIKAVEVKFKNKSQTVSVI